MIVIIIMLFSGKCISQEKHVLTGWKTAIKSDSITIDYRWITNGGLCKVREMKVVFYTKGTSKDMIRNLNNTHQLEKWNLWAKVCKVIKSNSNEWIIYTLYDVPFPFSKQDLICRYSLSRENASTIIDVQSLPGYLNKIKGVVRQYRYQGKWILKPEPDGKTRVEFTSVSYTKPILPRFIQDPVLQKILIDSFSRLKRLSEIS